MYQTMTHILQKAIETASELRAIYIVCDMVLASSHLAHLIYQLYYIFSCLDVVGLQCSVMSCSLQGSLNDMCMGWTRSFAGSCVLLSIPTYSSLFPHIPFNSHGKLPALKIERILQLYFQSLRRLLARKASFCLNMQGSPPLWTCTVPLVRHFFLSFFLILHLYVICAICISDFGLVVACVG